jgi:hypothetical protein
VWDEEEGEDADDEMTEEGEDADVEMTEEE